jgi:hypothetical protein
VSRIAGIESGPARHTKPPSGGFFAPAIQKHNPFSVGTLKMPPIAAAQAV